MKVSILVPVYGVEKYIERCARSLFEQTYEDLEYIFVDDCSPDNSIEILKNTLENYPKRKEQVKIIHHDKNQGLSGARNTALSHATGDYVIFVDSDDEVCRSCIDDMEGPLGTSGKEVDFVVADFNPVGFYNAQSALNLKQGLYNGDDIFDTYCNYDWYIMAWNKLVNRQFMLKNNLLFYPGIIHEDALWSFQLASIAKSMLVVSKETYIYYCNPGSIMTSVAAKRDVRDCLTIIREMQKIVTEKKLDIFKSWNRLGAIFSRAERFMKELDYNNYKIYRILRQNDISKFREKVRWCFCGKGFHPNRFHSLLPTPLGYAYRSMYSSLRNKLAHKNSHN